MLHASSSRVQPKRNRSLKARRWTHLASSSAAGAGTRQASAPPAQPAYRTCRFQDARRRAPDVTAAQPRGQRAERVSNDLKFRPRDRSTPRLGGVLHVALSNLPGQWERLRLVVGGLPSVQQERLEQRVLACLCLHSTPGATAAQLNPGFSRGRSTEFDRGGEGVHHILLRGAPYARFASLASPVGCGAGAKPTGARGR